MLTDTMWAARGRGVKDNSRNFSLNNWQDSTIISWDLEDSGRTVSGTGGRVGIRSSVLRLLVWMLLRHLAVGHLNLDFKGLGWGCDSGGFELALPMTTQGDGCSSAWDWELGSPLRISSLGCVLGSLLQPPYLPTRGLQQKHPLLKSG